MLKSYLVNVVCDCVPVEALIEGVEHPYNINGLAGSGDVCEGHNVTEQDGAPFVLLCKQFMILII